MLAENLSYVPPDAIFALTAGYNADIFAQKVNLGQGTYKDELGKPYILPSVVLAKEKISASNHEYLPILGLPAFRQLAVDLVFGPDSAVVKEDRVACSQSLSGTGALHIAGSFLRLVCDQSATVYITEPSWSNHRAVFASAGFPVQTYPYLDQDSQFDFEKTVDTLEKATSGSIFVLHACAHNPSGCDPSHEQWKQIARIMQRRKLFPLFDAAYLGLTTGDLDEDAFAIRYFVREIKMEVAVCLSFAKSMGLYGERTGAVIFTSESTDDARVATSHLEKLQRAEISNPPAYGARIVAAVLGDPKLQAVWKSDLVRMSARLRVMRHRLFEEMQKLDCPRDFSHVVDQVGMFCILGLNTDQVRILRDVFHVYMADSSRISIAGLNESNVVYVAEAISAVVCTDTPAE